MTFSLFTVFLLHIFPFLADFSRFPVPGAKHFLFRKTSLYENGHNFFSVYDINIQSRDKSCANILALIWSSYGLKMLTQSKDMVEKQNPSRTWYISLIFKPKMSARLERVLACALRIQLLFYWNCIFQSVFDEGWLVK